MLFRQLEYFVTLAREKHFARAAAACYVSQPALSEAIRKLEHELDVPLVHRGHAFEGLTPEGERLVLWARRILADHDALKHEVSAIRSGLEGQLRLGVIPAASTTAALVIAPFCAEHPLARVRLQGGLPTSQITERLARFELDAGIGYASDGSADGFVTTPLYEEAHVLIAARDLLGDAEQMEWGDAVQLPLCLEDPSMQGRQLLDRLLEEQGLSVRPQVEANSIAAISAMVGTGRWASIVPGSWMPAFARSPSIRAIPVVNPVLSAPIVLMLSEAEPGSVLGRALAQTASRLALPDVLGQARAAAGSQPR